MAGRVVFDFQGFRGKGGFFIRADIRYHEFFVADGEMVIADIGHYESEQFTINLLQEVLEKIPNFAVLKTEVDTNPVHYLYSKRKINGKR